jgi:iduronate 2-sulfatase
MWEKSQVSGSMCHLGSGFKGGLRKGSLHDPEWRSQVYSRVPLLAPPKPKRPHPPHRPPPPPPPARPIVAPPMDAKNVLLIVADDMRPDLPMYGNSIVHAPNLQRIADRGVTFNQAHIQISYCCPSRNSFMSGRRPDTSQVWTFETTWREAGTTADQRARVRNFTDLPQWFKQNGWWTTNTGKTWHNSVGYNPDDDWSDLAEFPSVFAWPGVYYDVNNTDVSVQRIHHAASLRQPFLVAHGFIKPHLPWDYPPELKAKYYGAYTNGSRTVPPATNPTYPTGTSPVGFHQCAEMPVESLEVPFPPAKVSALRLEYFATISYVDQQIGRLLDALEETGVANRTAVLFLGALLSPMVLLMVLMLVLLGDRGC